MICEGCVMSLLNTRWTLDGITLLQLQVRIKAFMIQVSCSTGLAGLLTNVAIRLPGCPLSPPRHRSRYLRSTALTARVAQWIRRRSPKPKIGGSSPPVGKIVFGQYFSVASVAAQLTE